MRKRLIDEVKPATSLESGNWLNLENLVEVEISSEDAAHPIESALTPGAESGWRAAVSGKQTIRLVFNQPQRLRKILLSFVERSISRTQEYVLRWSADGASHSMKSCVNNGTSTRKAPTPRPKSIRLNCPASTFSSWSLRRRLVAATPSHRWHTFESPDSRVADVTRKGTPPPANLLP